MILGQPGTNLSRKFVVAWRRAKTIKKVKRLYEMPKHMWQILTTHDNTYLVRCHLHTKSPELQACLFLSVFWCLFPGVSSHHFGFKAKWPLAQKTTTGTAVSSGSSVARASISVCGMLMLPSTWPSSYLRCNGWCNLRLTICSHFFGGSTKTDETELYGWPMF